MNTRERAKALRKAMKERGITSHQVSVRSEYFSLGSSISVTIKDPDISLAVIRELALEHSRIDRDQRSGEILSGCNRYVSVQIGWDAKKKLADRWLDRVKDAAAQVKTGHFVKVKNTSYLVSRSRETGALELWDNGFICQCNSEEELAANIGERMVDGLWNQ